MTGTVKNYHENSNITVETKITTSESKNDAIELAKNLGINFFEMPIKEMFETSTEMYGEKVGFLEKYDAKAPYVVPYHL